MKTSFRVIKYLKRDIDGNVFTEPDDWTSFYDVGKKVTLEDYLNVESEYLGVIDGLCKALDVHELVIDGLEKNIDNYFFSDNQIVSNGDILLVAQSALREEIWCKLISEKLEVHFGYDFYMYVVCGLNLSEINEKIKTSLKIEEFYSPYL